MANFLDRTRPILGQDGLNAISTPLVAIAGLGGVGGGTFLNLVRAGVKRFRLAENGIFDPPDMNRQAAAFTSTMDLPKIQVYEQLAREINPEVELELFPEGTLVDNIERFLEGSDVYVGVIDMEKGQDVKAMTPELLTRFNIPLFTAAAVGFGALLVAHHPEGMMPDEFWGLLNKKSTGNSMLPSMIYDRFDRRIMERISDAARTGTMATTSIGGVLSGALLASEVLVWLLRGTGFADRETTFAPRFAVIDLLRPALDVIDITKDVSPDE